MYSKQFGILLAAASIGATAAASAAPVGEPLARPALMVSQPQKAFLTSLALAGTRLVGVGERGIVVLSDDGGKTWRQAKVPASVTLAAVHFPTPTHGWAVGHYGVILHSADGGQSWARQLDGTQAAQLVLRDARATAGQGGAATEAYLAEAQRLVADGPDKPFLSLHFRDDKNGVVVGAYNLAFRTTDGGKSWTPLSGRLDNPKASHLYAVRTAGSEIVIAGEQGLLLRSTDGGARFSRVETPYKGSFFALVQAGTDIVVGGLGGNAFRSVDKGLNWTRIAVPVPVSITGMDVRGGTLLMANQAGMLLSGPLAANAVQPLKMAPLPPLNDVLAQPDGSIVAASMFGALRLPPQAGVTPVSVAAK